MKKKILVVILSVVIVCSCALTSSASYIDVNEIGNNYTNNFTAYNMYPITFRFATNSNTRRNVEVNIGRTINIRSGISPLGTFTYEDSSLAFSETRSFQRVGNNVKGGTTILADLTTGDNNVLQYYLSAITLGDVFAIPLRDDSRIGENSPLIMFNPIEYETVNVPIGVNFSCAYLDATGEYRIFERYIPLNASGGFNLLPNNLLIELENQMTNNGELEITDFVQIFQPSYTYVYNGAPSYDKDTTVSVSWAKNGTTLRTLRDEKGNATNNPYVVDYELAYDRVSTVYVDTFDFSNFLSSAFTFLDVELFGDFTIGGLLSTVLGIAILIAFLKIFAGG